MVGLSLLIFVYLYKSTILRLVCFSLKFNFTVHNACSISFILWTCLWASFNVIVIFARQLISLLYKWCCRRNPRRTKEFIENLISLPEPCQAKDSSRASRRWPRTSTPSSAWKCRARSCTNVAAVLSCTGSRRRYDVISTTGTPSCRRTAAATARTGRSNAAKWWSTVGRRIRRKHCQCSIRTTA